MKVLNLYACLGGNRLLWDNCEVTAVELDEDLARLYQERFPNDTVIVADAHQYLLDHYQEFDFIWSSPPCPSHSRARFWNTKAHRIYPDLKLYEEILFLSTHFDGKYVVENVIPYYTPLIPAKKRGRHLYWTNFNLPLDLGDRRFSIGKGKDSTEIAELSTFHNYNFKKYKGKQFINKIARNLVDYEAGNTIFNVAIGLLDNNNKSEQATLF